MSTNVPSIRTSKDIINISSFKKDNIIWVPISLEEVLRVSGGAGLKQSEGFFSAKNLGFEGGVTSDDILLVGIETVNGNVFVHYYPIEVKIGENANINVNAGQISVSVDTI